MTATEAGMRMLERLRIIMTEVALLVGQHGILVLKHLGQTLEAKLRLGTPILLLRLLGMTAELLGPITIPAPLRTPHIIVPQLLV